MNTDIEKEIARCLKYNPKTGILTWKVNRRGGANSGDEAGSVNSMGYIQIKVWGRYFAAHRIAWFLHYGEWPRQSIDHIDRIKTDNRICNLRDVSHFENHLNRSDNTSGVVGGVWHKGAKKWQAQIMANKKHIYLGIYENLESAIKIRKAPEIKYHGITGTQS